MRKKKNATQPLFCDCGQRIITRNYQGEILTVGMQRSQSGKHSTEQKPGLGRILFAVNDKYPMCKKCVRMTIEASIPFLLGERQ